MSTATVKEVLKNKKVTVKPIVRDNGFYGKDHDGATLFTGAQASVTLPVEKNKNHLVPIFDKEEQAFLENELGLPKDSMNFYKKDNEFWRTFRVKLTKEEFILDLSKPVDFIKYKVLLANKFFVAPSWKDRNEDARYRFAIVEEGQEDVDQVNKQSKKIKAYKAFVKIEDSREKMSNLLRVIGLHGKTVTENSTIEFLRAELGRMIEDPKTIETFLSVVEDKNYELRLFIADGVEAGAIEKRGRASYGLPGRKGEIESFTLQEAIDYIKDAENQPIVMKIKAQIDASKGKKD